MKLLIGAMCATIQGCVLLFAISAVSCNKYSDYYENSTLTLHNDPVTWSTAASACNDSDSTFLNILENDPNILGEAKRAAHFRRGGSGWIGSYVTYDIDLSQDSDVNMITELCLAMRFTSENAEGKIFRYTYDILAINCTQSLYTVCNGSYTLTFYSEKTSLRRDACTRDGGLWTPPMTFYNISVGETIASGNFSGSDHNGDLVGNAFWIKGRISTAIVHLPVEESTRILQCGYIASNESNINYVNCYQKKSYMCETVNHGSLLTTANPDNYTGTAYPKSLSTTANSGNYTEQATKSLTSSKVVIYVGAAVGLVAFVGVCVFAVFMYKRKANKRVQDSNDDNNLPKGGKSFTRPKAPHVGTNDIDYRISTYNKIDIDQFESPESGKRFELESQQSVPSVVSSAEFVYAMYDPSRKKGAVTLPSSAAPPKPARSHPGYLTMDGKHSSDSHYDVLKSTGSTKSGSHEREVPTDTDENIYAEYSMTMSDEQESFYDSTIITRHPSQKALINNDYDHVTLNTDPEMDRSVCNSLTTSGSTKRPVPLPRSNPGYEKVDAN